MMEKLPEDFSLEKYGLKVRLINEDDAEFILSLRANPDRTKHMVTLEHDIKKQRKWIQEYKIREKIGLDYYFLYSNKQNKPYGVNRASQLNYASKTAKASSWIAVEGLKYEPLKMLLIGNEIIFNFIKIDKSWGEVHKKNERVIKIFNIFGYKFDNPEKEYYNFSLTKENFEKACKNRIISNLKK